MIETDDQLPRRRGEGARRRRDVRPDRAALRPAQPHAHLPAWTSRGAAPRCTRCELVAGARVLDLACGTGDLCRTLAADGLRSRSASTSRPACSPPPRTDAPLVRADAAHLPFADGAVDGLTCGFALRNFVDLAPVLAECARVLRPRGRIALRRRERAHRARRPAPCTACGSGASCRSSAACSSDRSAYAYLPASTAYLPARPELLRDGRRGRLRSTSRTARSAPAPPS